MPIYTYRCKNCGNEFDLRQSFYDEPITVCSVCDGSVRRVIQNVPVLFKGSGFYVTDNRSGKSNGSPNGKGPKVSESTSEGKESKTEEKTKKAETKTSEKSTTKTSASKPD